jgi:PKD repeat protein
MRHEYSARNTAVNPRSVVGMTVFVVLLLVLSTGPAFAHVGLDDPNGGETLVVGSSYRIVWHDVVYHGPADFDLWYSTTGPDGPWIEIIMDVEDYVYDWTVPDAPSDQVRVRVRQDNVGIDYLDWSDSDLAIVKVAEPDTVDIEASQDATLYEGDGSLANGAGSFVFTGRTNSQSGSLERRALVAFDIESAIPEGSTITEVSLEMMMSRTRPGAQTVELHRVTESWGEGASDASGEEGGGANAGAGDVTWVHREFPDTNWATVGGSFSQTVSGTQQIGGTGSYTWSSTAQMVADVQGWLDDPSSNHGWALVIPSPATASAKRFNSRENSGASSRPRLTVSYEAGMVAPTADFSFNPPNPRVGEEVSFIDQSTGSPTAWQWDFGDGGSSEEQDPSHVFTAADTFTVSITATNDAGEDTASMEITVLPEGEPELTELVLIPAAANAGGSGDSFFVTTVDVHNAGFTTASFRFLWLPRGADNADPDQSALIMLEPGGVLRFDNLLEELFGLTNALGAAAVVSDSADLVVMSRTFNQSADGTFGQSVPGVAAEDLIQAGTRVLVLFLTEDGEFRSNLGLVNGGDSPITVQWELFAADGTSLRTGSTDLPAWGNVQLNRVLRSFAPIEAAYAHVWTMTTGGAFTCYGSVLDELTSDPTTVLPQ